jgi:hypothetical protein
MFARLTLMQGPPERSDEAARLMAELLPKAKRIPGLVSTSWGLDRSTGKAVTFTVYDSEESLKSSAEVVRQIRDRSAEVGTQILIVETYQLIAD